MALGLSLLALGVQQFVKKAARYKIAHSGSQCTGETQSHKWTNHGEFTREVMMIVLQLLIFIMCLLLKLMKNKGGYSKSAMPHAATGNEQFAQCNRTVSSLLSSRRLPVLPREEKGLAGHTLALNLASSHDTHLGMEPIGRHKLGDSHFIGGQSPRLIRADDVAATWHKGTSGYGGEHSHRCKFQAYEIPRLS